MNIDSINYGPRLHMLLWACISVAWLILGANSENVPWGTPNSWLLGCALASGAAIGVAWRRTRSSMLVYLIAAFIVSAIRSGAYIWDGSDGPAYVWLIVTITNLILLGHWTTEPKLGAP